MEVLSVEERSQHLPFDGDLAVDERSADDLDKPAFGLDDLALEAELVARHHGPPELHVIDLAEKNEFLFGLGDGIKKQYAARLGHAFDDQHAGHDPDRGKMTLKEFFVVADVLERDDRFPLLEREHPVDEEKRVAMGKKIQDVFDVIQGDARYFVVAFDAS
jgi:hypothetical protein